MPRHDGRVGAGRGRVDSPDGSGFRRRDKVDEFLNGPEEWRLESFHEVTLPSTCFQNDAGVAVIEGADHTFLPRLTLRDLGPVVDADHRGLHGLPDVDVGMAGDPDVAVIDLGSDPRLLRAVDEVVEQDAEATAIAGAKASPVRRGRPLPQVVRRRHPRRASRRPRPSR